MFSYSLIFICSCWSHCSLSNWFGKNSNAKPALYRLFCGRTYV